MVRRARETGVPPAKRVTRTLLRRWPVPQPSEDSSKKERGTVLVVAGARQTPGAAILAATAALRAGAGTLQIATVRGMAAAVAGAVPEALVLALPETPAGAISPRGVPRLREALGEADAVLFGPGMVDERATAALLAAVLTASRDSPHEAVWVLDAAALKVAAPQAGSLPRSKGTATVLTPHDGEMARLLGIPASRVAANRAACAVEASRRFRAVVALKGMETLIASPDGVLLMHRALNPGLGTSGSGDTLSGIVAGLAARGAAPLAAAAWGVFVHAQAGSRLTRRLAPLGFLARELLAEIPRVLPRR
jgi:ADP-dependent NAD(P)H-hydrate dehydratase